MKQFNNLTIKKIFVIIFLSSLVSLIAYHSAYADSAISNGINYLGTQLDGATGQIKGGSTGDASPWAAMAFAANSIDPSTIKSSDGAPSLVDYLQTNHPTTSSSATEWEKWILAITASGQNPYNFGGTNYVSTLESSTYYSNSQLGDINSVNDDWFGVMALIASGVNKTDSVLNDSLNFVISHQNSDGGYGYSPTADSDGNDTSAAIQALEDAKNYGLTNANLDTAINNAKTYLLSTQDSSGGFLYDKSTWTTTPDSDSTTWALMALNTLNMQSSDQANKAKTWLISQQSNDGGFQACQYNPPDYLCQLASNSTTTSNALIGLAGKGWLIKIFDASSTTPAPTVIPRPKADQPLAETQTPTPTPVVITNTNTVYVYPTITPAPSQTQTEKTIYITKTITVTATPTPVSQVLGIKTEKVQSGNNQQNQLPIFFTGMGLSFLLFYAWDLLKKILK